MATRPLRIADASLSRPQRLNIEHTARPGHLASPAHAYFTRKAYMLPAPFLGAV